MGGGGGGAARGGGGGGGGAVMGGGGGGGPRVGGGGGPGFSGRGIVQGNPGTPANRSFSSGGRYAHRGHRHRHHRHHFRGPVFGFGYGDPYYYSYGYVEPGGCWERRRVRTARGLRWSWIDVCRYY